MVTILNKSNFDTTQVVLKLNLGQTKICNKTNLYQTLIVTKQIVTKLNLWQKFCEEDSNCEEDLNYKQNSHGVTLNCNQT